MHGRWSRYHGRCPGHRLNSLAERGDVYNAWKLYSTASGLANGFFMGGRKALCDGIRDVLWWKYSHHGFHATGCWRTGLQNSRRVKKITSMSWLYKLVGPAYRTAFISWEIGLFNHEDLLEARWLLLFLDSIKATQMYVSYQCDLEDKSWICTRALSQPALHFPSSFFALICFYIGVVPNIFLKSSFLFLFSFSFLFFYQKARWFFSLLDYPLPECTVWTEHPTGDKGGLSGFPG